MTISSNVMEVKEFYKFNKMIDKSNMENLKLLGRPTPPDKDNYKDTYKIQIKYSSRGYHIVPMD